MAMCKITMPSSVWQVIDYPLGNKLIVNVPEVTNSVMHQWVQNPISKAWCRFRNWNANCWELQQDALYYGENTQVFLADTGMSDAGVAIVEDCKPAFSYFDKPGQIKRFVMARPIFQANAAIQPVISLNVDFQDIQGAPPIFTASASGSPWNTSPWNTSPWASANVFIKNWQGIAGLGYVASGRITLQTSGVTCNWYSTDFMSRALGAPSELLFGEDERVAQWVESRVGFGLGRPATAIGLQRQGKIIAGVMYTHYSERGSISAHIAGEGHWCSRRFLHTIFYYPFRQLKVRRITCYVESRHYKSRALCEHLGFTLESLMENVRRQPMMCSFIDCSMRIVNG